MKNNRYYTIIGLMALVVFVGCTREQLGCESSGRSIRPVLSSWTETKSMSEPDSDNGMPIAVIPVSENPGDSLYMIVYEKDMPDMLSGRPATKGMEVTSTSLTTFRMKAYAQEDWHDNETNADHQAGAYFGVPTAATVTKGSSEWTISPEQKWLNGVPTSFWSWNEVEPVIDEQEGYDKASFTYTVASAVTSQKDLVLAYNGENVTFSNAGAITNHTSTNADYTRTDDQMDIHFYHALSAIMFDISGVEDVTVDKITLSGIYPGGDCEVTVSDQGVPEFGWTVKGTPTSYSQAFDASDFGTDGKQVADSGKVFMLIPQALNDDSAISVTFSGEDSPAKSIKGTGVTWKPGKYYTYKLSKSADSFDYTFHFEVDGLQKDAVSQDVTGNTEEDGWVEVNVVSTKEDAQGTAAHQGWKIKSYKLDGEDAVTVNSSSFTDTETGIEATAYSGRIELWIDPRPKVGKGGHAYWTDQSRQEDRDWSPASWAGQEAIDLSRMDYTKDDMSQSVNAFDMTTANCYVIRHAGRYRLPLVYGNAMNGGQVNAKSYYPNADHTIPNGDISTDSYGNTIRLVRFENHLGRGITDPFIENNTGCVMDTAEILWQSDDDVIKDIQLTGDVQSTGGYSKQNVRYIEFTVDPDKICQNVALIAVRDVNGKVAWSWNIWTTNNPALTEESIEVRNYDGYSYKFFPVPNIGHIDTWTYKEMKTMQITLQQETSNKTIVLTIKQPEVGAVGFNALYQFGRKDPFVNKNDIHYHSPSLSSAISLSAPPPQASLADYISNPTTFYEFDLPTFNYPLDKPYMNLWTGRSCVSGLAEQNSDIIKTVYDPSPIGYKVPAGKAFTGFTTTGDNLWKPIATSDPAKLFKPERVNGFWDYGSNVYFYTSQGSNHTVNTGGKTICFPVTKIRAGGTGGVMKNNEGWYFTSNIDYSTNGGVNPFLMTIEFGNGELVQMRPITIAGHNAHAVRPVIDVTMPGNPMN